MTNEGAIQHVAAANGWTHGSLNRDPMSRRHVLSLWCRRCRDEGQHFIDDDALENDFDPIGRILLAITKHHPCPKAAEPQETP